MRHHFVIDHLQLLVGAQTGELGNAIPPGIDSESFVVVPEKRVHNAGGAYLRITETGAISLMTRARHPLR
jgi:hypothetical protein